MARINGTTSKNGYLWFADVNERFDSNYVATNKSIVDYTVYIQNQGKRFNTNGWTKRAGIDGVAVWEESNANINTTTVGYYDAMVVMSGSKEIEHDADGSCSIWFEAYISKSSYGSYDPGWSYLNAQITLSTIPRASVPTAGTQTIGQALTINTNRKSTSFTHNLYYSFGGIGKTLIASGVGDNHPWTLPSTLYAQIPNAKSGTGTIYCDTYNGSTKIGDTQTCSFTALVNESESKPSTSLTVTDTNSKTVALTGNSSKLVKYYSTAKMTVKATAKNSATISSISIRANDIIKTSTENPYEVSFENVTGNDFQAYATDSRGLSSSIEVKNPDIVQYIVLTCNDTLYRPTQTSNELKLKVSGNFFNGSFGKSTNTLSLKYRYREKDASSYGAYTTITPTISNNTYSADISMGTNFNYQKAYDVEVVAEDLLDSKTATSSISQGVPILWIGEDYIEVFGVRVFSKD